MARRAAAFKQTDVTRAVKGALDGGMKIGRVEIAEGKIVIIAPSSAPEPQNDMDAWLGRRNASSA